MLLVPGIDPKPSFAEVVTQVGQVVDPGPAQNEWHEPGQNQYKRSPNHHKLICGAEIVSLVDCLHFQYRGDSSMVCSGDAVIVRSAVERQHGATEQPEHGEEYRPNGL